MIDVFTYTDFRAFLKDAIVERKYEDPSFTHRFICAELGLRTSNFILLVTQGKRNLSTELGSRMAGLLGLKDSKAEYFLWMVLFTQALTNLEKEKYWGEMMVLRTRSVTTRIDDSQYEYYSHWYNPVIRELVIMPGMVWDARSLGKALRPRVSAVQVRHSIELLERLGFIRREGDAWVKASPSLATPPEVQSVAIFNYHKELIELAKTSLSEVSGAERNFTTVTVEMNAQEYQMVVGMLTEFRRNVLAVGGSTGASDRVYQLNLQLFPVSHTVASVQQLQDDGDEA